MEKNNTATTAILVCMVAAISTIPALLIVGSFQQPNVNNYYTTAPAPVEKTTITTNTTIYVNGTYPIVSYHFVNITASIPRHTSNEYVVIYSIPLVNRSLITNVVSFSFNHRIPGAGNNGYTIYPMLNGKTIPINYEYPYITGYTIDTDPFYSCWNNPNHIAAYPNASSYLLSICGYSSDVTWTSINVSVSIWYETW